MKKSICLIILMLFILSPLVGQIWYPQKRLTWNSGISWKSAVAVDLNNRAHVVWQDDTPGNDEIYYKSTPNNGASWSTLKRLTWNTGDSVFPSIATDSSNKIHVVWQDNTPGDNEIFYKNSTNNGTSWSAPKRLTWNVYPSTFPSIAIDPSNKIQVVWQFITPGNSEIFHKNSTDGGANWSPPNRLTWNAGFSSNSSIAADSSSGIHVVWIDNTPGNIELFYKNSTDGGAIWSALKRLTWNAEDSWSPSIAADSGSGIHIVWEDYTPTNYKVFYKRSFDSGASWSAPKRLTWDPGAAYGASIAIWSSGVHVVWSDNTFRNWEIIYRHSQDRGTNWNAAKRISWNSGTSDHPSIAADSNNGIHIVWQDESYGNKEILYKYGKWFIVLPGKQQEK